MGNDIKKQMSRKSRKWLAAGLVVFVMVVTGLLGSIFYQYYITVIDNQEEQLMTISRAVTRQLDLAIGQGFQNAEYLVSTKMYAEGREELLLDGDESGLLSVLSQYENSHLPYTSNMILAEENMDMPLFSLFDRSYERVCDVSTEPGWESALWKDSEGNMFLALEAEDRDGYSLFLLLDVEAMYQQMISDIKLGDRGYVMIKASNGIIIMHILKEQIGLDAVADRESIYPGAEISNTTLESMINNQKQGKEGVEIYTSYWWADEKLKPARKISAYSPAHVGNGFLIVSAVMDYEEVAAPLTTGVIRIVVLSLFVFSGLTSLLFLMIRSQKKRESTEQENQVLNELNQTLQTLHENEQIMAHQQRLQIIGTMTGGIAHEFNNLLTPIMGYSGMMVEMMDKENPFYEDAEEIYDSAEKAKEIIHQISSLSKRNMDTVYRYCDVEKLLKRVGKMAESIKPPNIELLVNVEIADGGKKGVFGNATQLNQVLLNLIVNGVHAIGSGKGVIEIGYRSISHLEQDDYLSSIFKQSGITNGDYGEITVRDNGCGMDGETLTHIFDPFFTTRASSGGTGLGLSIAQNIVEAHRGVLAAESRTGEGTVFHIILPTAEEAADKQRKELPVSEKEKSESSVLLVDDNPKVLKLLQKGLAAEGFLVSARQNPLEALDDLNENSYDLMVTDDAMKEMNGLYLASRARQQNPDMPVIILTGMLRKEVIEARQTGIIAEYMIKPITVQSLAQIMKEVCRHSAVK